MKANYFLRPVAVTITIIGCMLLNTSKACVDYHPVPPPLTVKIDSLWTEMEITMHQLNIFVGSTGDFCTCALSAFANLFDSIYYVAFVDSGTTDPIPGFGIWNADADATNAWAAAMTGTSWDGFVAGVVSTIAAGLPVELIIRAKLPPGYTTTSSIDSVLTLASLGTDQWDDVNNVLAYTHNSVSGLGSATYILVPPGFFTGTAEVESQADITVFPNPFSAQTTLHAGQPLQEATLLVYNYFGQAVARIRYINGQSITFNRDNLVSGVYFIRLTQDNNLIATEKIVITD